MGTASSATASTHHSRGRASPRKPRRPSSPGRWRNRERAAYGRRSRRGTSPHSASPPMPDCTAPVAWRPIPMRDRSRSGSGHGSSMTKPHKPILSSLRAVVLTITLLVATSGAIGGALAQDTDAETALERELEANLDRIARETADLRELPPLAEITDVLVSQDELLAMIPELVAEEITPEDAAAQSRALAALGLIPPGTDLLALTERLLGEQAAGFYDPLTDEMLVVFDGNPGLTEYFYAHEVIHALQDAHLDPDDLMEDLSALNGDEKLATLALYEGDAVAGSAAYLEQHPALVGAFLREVGRDSPEMGEAPASVSIVLLFPYVSGMTFVDRLLAEGGWDAVDAAYADTPASTEQILHPLKYLERDEPSLIALPDPTSALGAGWWVVDEDTLGELQTAVLLADFAPGEGFNGITGDIVLPEAARNAAAGWDGDRFALWDDGERQTLVWRSVWDTPEDARAFSRALAQFGNDRWNGVFNGESPDDVALVTPEIAARILLDGQEVLYVQAPDLALADAALAALQTAPPPDPAPGPN